MEDRGYQFADGVYEVIYVLGGRLIDSGLHLDRLDRSLGELRLQAPASRASLLVVAREVVRRNRLDRGLLYIQVTRGVARRDHAFPPPGTPPALVVLARRTPPFPPSLDGWSADAITCPDQRWARCDIKTVCLLPNALARQAAREAGALEAILYDRDGMVTEGASTTVWVVDEAGRLRTRPLGRAVLPGCTRAALAAELAGAGIAWEERSVSLDELRQAREIFLTAATTFVKPVLHLDGAPVGGGTAGPVATTMFDILRHHILAQP